jgi:hypothetical protein
MEQASGNREHATRQMEQVSGNPGVTKETNTEKSEDATMRKMRI